LFLCAAPLRAQKVDVVQVLEQVATLISNNRLAVAEKELTSVLRVAPNLPAALNLMGSIRAKQGRLD
jgi:Flp pilus assembly protein TadD